jgi:hypothetical protein
MNGVETLLTPVRNEVEAPLRNDQLAGGCSTDAVEQHYHYHSSLLRTEVSARTDGRLTSTRTRTRVPCADSTTPTIKRSRLGEKLPRWTPEQDEKLLELTAVMRDHDGVKRWEDIATQLGSGRSASAVEQRYRYLIGKAVSPS